MKDDRIFAVQKKDNDLWISSFFWKTGISENIGSRQQQQDTTGTIICTKNEEPALLAVLADGMGGMNNGGDFSRIAVKSALDNFQDVLDVFSSPTNMLLYLAFNASYQTSKIYDCDHPGGTTFIAALFMKNNLYFLSVGDSRIYLFRDGKPMQLNREHILSCKLDEKAWSGQLSFEDAEGNIYRNSLTSSIGEGHIRQIDLIENPIHLMAGDKIVLMSDGVFKNLSEKEIADSLSASPDKASDSIIKRVLKKNNPDQDNMSVIVIENQL